LKPHPTLSVANYFIGKAHEAGESMTLLRLIKLVYIAHGWCLGLTGKPLIGEEVQAWKYGPIVPSVYHDFRSWGQGSIGQQKALLNGDGNYVIPTVKDAFAKQLLNKVWDEYRDFDGLQLSTLTHQEGTPWDVVNIRHRGELRNDGAAVISPELIARYYMELAEQNRNLERHAPQVSVVVKVEADVEQQKNHNAYHSFKTFVLKGLKMKTHHEIPQEVVEAFEEKYDADWNDPANLTDRKFFTDGWMAAFKLNEDKQSVTERKRQQSRENVR